MGSNWVSPGTAGTAYTSYTPGVSSTTNISTRTGQYRQNSDGQMELQVDIRWNGAGDSGSAFEVDLPSGYTINTSKYLGTTSGTESTDIRFDDGMVSWWDQGVGYTPVEAFYSDTNTIKFHWGRSGGVLLGTTFAASDVLRFTLKLWVTGPGY